MDAPRCDAQRSQKGSEAAFARQEVVRMMVAWLFTFLLAVIAENAERVSDSVAELRAVGAYLQTLDVIIKRFPF